LDATEVIDHRGDVFMLVGIDPADHLTERLACHRGHATSFCVNG
jgi:hypothetical protein